MKEYPEMMTPQEAAEFLRCGRANIYVKLRRGTLPGFRVGHEWRLPKSELIALARANMDKSKTEKAGA